MDEGISGEGNLDRTYDTRRKTRTPAHFRSKAHPLFTFWTYRDVDT